VILIIYALAALVIPPLVIRNYHLEESGATHEDEQTFESVKEVLAYID